MPKRLEQPVPFVVAALSTLKRYKVKRVLDLGCGAGRHCIYLAEKGFNVIGLDVSTSALKLAAERAEVQGLKTNATFLKATMTNIPFKEGKFDAVVSVSVIHHAMRRDIAKAITEIHRVLRKDGLFLANLASVNDLRCGEGVRIEEGTYRILEAFEERWFQEIHHFFAKEEAVKMLSCFSKSRAEALRDKFKYWKVTAFK